MNSKDLILMSLQNLARRKSRTILTVIGVVIGTCSIVIMLSLGIALDKSFHEQISEMGNLNIIDVHNYYYGPDMAGSEQMKLDEKAVLSFEQIPGVEAVMPRKSMYLKIGAGKLVAEVDVVGIKPEILAAFDFEIGEGRLLVPTDKEAIIFGQHVPYSFYNPRLRNRDYNPWDREGPPPVDLVNSKLIITSDMQYGERIRNRDSNQKPAKQYEFKGVGILKEKNDEKDYSAYINMATLEKMIKEEEKANRNDESRRGAGLYNNDEYTSIKVKCAKIETVTDIQDTIKAMGFQAFSLTDMIESVKKQSRTMQGILGGIGAVSLFVAAIGITNTMIMSIYERTREIGVIKVLGAELQDIKRLFLIEAGFIGFIGGIVGLILSYLISFGLNKVGAGWTGGSYISVIPAYLAIGAVVFATFVGLVSGYSPARRAMNLSALEAIRSE
ncbi:MAG TPA: ABC transporter permease [Syntrophomonadaceae bacterium]|nr:ABC transporter permease [Syntrophomonadaceae bacterium]